MWTLLPLALVLGCLEEPAYQCQSDDACFYSGFSGICDLATASCAYQSVDCQGLSSIEGWVNARGLCVPAPNNSEPSSTTGDSGGGVTSGSTSSVTTSQPTTSDPTEDADADTTNGIVTGPESSTGSAEGESSGADPSTGAFGPCDGLTDDLTGDGTVTASSVFDENDFPATASVDGLLSTSWFSSGPEGGGGPSVYSWSTVTDRCINRIEVDDNSMHSNGSFQDNFGFTTIVVHVLQDDIVVFEETVPVPNSPDGPFAVETGGLLGSRVLLELGGHENTSCGGFSELRVIGGPAPD